MTAVRMQNGQRFFVTLNLRRTKGTLINTFLPFFKMAKRTLRFNQLFPNLFGGDFFCSDVI